MVRVAILTVSDRGAAGEREDLGGPLIAEMAAGAGHVVVARAVVPDERGRIAEVLRGWADGAVADVVVSTGGTGLTPRDVTPEATLDVAEREVPGIAVALVVNGLRHTPFAALTRGRAVTRGRTLIVNLPGNPKAVREGMEVLLPLLDHVGELLAGPVDHGAGSGG